MKTPGEYSIVLRRAAARMDEELEAVVAATLHRAREIAHDKVGVYQRGWPQLAASTVDSKGDDLPLWDKGILRESFYVDVENPRKGRLGSTRKEIVYSEYGTSSEPPRPLLKESVREAMKETGIARMRFVLTRALR